jgi:predicted permease
MARIPGVRRLFRLPWRTGRTVDEDIDEELRFHLDMRAAELSGRGGMDAEAAHAEALRQFGDIDDARRYIRSLDRRTERAARRRMSASGLWQDLRHTLRGLRRSPGFATVVVLSLAVGIGAVTAVFTLVNAVLLRQLPVSNPDELVGFGNPALVSEISSGSARTDLFSYELYQRLRERSRTVPKLFASGTTPELDVVVTDGAGVSREGEAEHPSARLVSGNYFDVLGVHAALGRTFTDSDDRAPGAGPVAVISHAYWQRRFHLDPRILGRTFLVNGTALTVIGVTPPEFFGEIMDHHTDLWIPLTMQPLVMPNQDFLHGRGTSWLLMMGRLAPRATVGQAGAEATRLTREFLAEGSDGDDSAGRVTVNAYPAARGFSAMRANIGDPLLALMALMGLVLLVVCANVANLLLARAAARRTEMSVRMALGAGRLRLMRHMLAESLVLGILAGAFALLVLRFGTAILFHQVSARGPVGLDMTVDPTVYAFAAVLSLAVALLLGLLSATRATKIDVSSTLRTNARGTLGDALGGRGRRLGLGRWLVVGQVAVSLVLLAQSGLIYRSVRNLLDRELGLARDELVIEAVDAHLGGSTGARLQNIYTQVSERLRRLPGVRSVSYSQNGIFSGTETGTSVRVPGSSALENGESTAQADVVGPDYFHTIGARLVRGRDIEASDDESAPQVAVINETMARSFFPDGDALGRTFQVDSHSYEIVGVVADVVDHDLRAAPVRRYYTAMAQAGAGMNVVFEIRTSGDPGLVIPAARRETLASDPSLRVPRIDRLARMVARSLESERVVATLAATAGGLALALAALGLYGVMTYMTVRRTGEFGLRMALGAQQRDVTGLVLREAMMLVVFGSAIGIPAALGVSRILRHQLVGVGVVDLPSLVLALGILVATATLAGYQPARRAGRVDPQVALQSE